MQLSTDRMCEPAVLRAGGSHESLQETLQQETPCAPHGSQWSLQSTKRKVDATMITDLELVMMRETATAALPATAQIIRSVPFADGAGGTTMTDSVIGVCPVRIGQASQSQLAVYADRLVGLTGVTLTVPVGTAVQPRDRLIIEGRTFDVIGAPDGGAWATAVRLMATEVTR